MALNTQPEFQRAMLKAHAKGSMTGNRPRTKAIQERLAAKDLSRKMAFKELSQARQRSDLSHAARTEQYKMDRQALSDRKKQMPWEIGIGIGTSLLSGLEGQRRARILKEAEANRQVDFKELMAGQDAREDAAYRRFYTPPRWRDNWQRGIG